MSMSWFLDEIERRLEDERQTRRELESEVARLSQMLHQVSTMASAPRGGSSTRLHWARVPTGGVLAATGTWPSLTPSSFTADVYRGGGGLTLASEAAAVHWYYLDGADEGDLVPCVPNGDGSYDAVTNSCTPIPEDA